MTFPPLFAQDAPAPAQEGGAGTGQADPKAAPPGGSLLQFAPFVLIALFFLVVMLPAKRRQKKEQEARMAAMKQGAKVLLNSGIVGRIVTMKDGDEEVVIKSEDSKFRVMKNTIASVLTDDAPADAKA